MFGKLNVFQLQDFNREAPVDNSGTIALPLIGAVPVAGKTVRQIETEIEERLKAKYLQDPQVLVTVKDAVGLRVAVQGAVKNPGSSHCTATHPDQCDRPSQRVQRHL